LQLLDQKCFSSFWKEDDFINLLSNEAVITFGYFDKDDCVGFVMALFTIYEAEIYRFCTHPDCRRKGIAESLIQHLISEAKDRLVVDMFLDVACDNLPAIACYLKMGFKKIHTRLNYYSLGNKLIDAVVMKKIII
jgi:ribosomal-protein-alanine N-acetyltransferase